MFQNKTKIQKLPRLLRESIEELLYEREHSGIETTPDETSNTIEELYQYLGKIWMCLFLDAASNPKNEEILPAASFLYIYENIMSIVNRNGTTIGNWIRISRYIQNVFKENAIVNPLSSLQNFDFGYFDKGDQRTNNLLSFRNEFAHGAFHANAQYIDEHFDILSDIFEDLKDLYQIPIVYVRNGEVWDANHQRIEISFPIESDGLDSKYAYLLCQEKQTLISLSPFFLFADKKLEENIFKKIKINDLFYAELFASFVERYTSEMDGNLDSNAAFNTRDEFEVDQNTLQDIRNVCEESSDKNIFLVEAYPGSHYKALGQELYANEPAGFDTCIFWDVKDQDITQSATALINKIRRVSENVLKCNISIRRKAKTKERLETIADALQKQGKKVLLYVNDLHLGMNSYRQEEYRIADIFQYLIDTPITVVATLHHGYLQKGLFYDAVLQYHKSIVDDEELKRAVSYYVNTERRKQIFSVLQHEESLHLFDICDQIEAKSSNSSVIFEPQVEYDLWRCSALLSMKREQKKKEEGSGIETLRLWSLAHPHIQKYL